MFTALVFDIQTGLGNTKVTVGLNLVWLVALLPALWIGANADGIRGAAIGHAVVAVLVAIPLAGWLLHRAGVSMGPVLRRIVRPVLAAVVAGASMAASPSCIGSAPRAAGGGRRAGDGRLRADRPAAERVGAAWRYRPRRWRSVGARHERPSPPPLVSIALPVYNGGPVLAPVVESVLAQTHSHLELVISDNASTDETQEICRRFARERPTCRLPAAGDEHRPAQQLHHRGGPRQGAYVRWIGDDDSIEPDYLAHILEVFAQDERRVMVTTQIVYAGTPVHTGYDPTALSSADPVVRFSGMLRLLTSDFAILDPLYSVMRRDLAIIPRRNILREDEVFATRLALAGPWGHVAAPLSPSSPSEVTAARRVQLLGVPRWHRHAGPAAVPRAPDWIAQSSLDPAQRRRARAEILRMYARRKHNKMRRGVTKLERMAGRPLGTSATGAP